MPDASLLGFCGKAGLVSKFCVLRSLVWLASGGSSPSWQKWGHFQVTLTFTKPRLAALRRRKSKALKSLNPRPEAHLTHLTCEQGIPDIDLKSWLLEASREGALQKVWGIMVFTGTRGRGRLERRLQSSRRSRGGEAEGGARPAGPGEAGTEGDEGG